MTLMKIKKTLLFGFYACMVFNVAHGLSLEGSDEELFIIPGDKIRKTYNVLNNSNRDQSYYMKALMFNAQDEIPEAEKIVSFFPKQMKRLKAGISKPINVLFNMPDDVQEYKGFICVYASKNQDSLFANLDLKRKNAESTIQEAMCRKFHLKRADSEYMDKVKKIEDALDKKLSD